MLTGGFLCPLIQINGRETIADRLVLAGFWCRQCGLRTRLHCACRNSYTKGRDVQTVSGNELLPTNADQLFFAGGRSIAADQPPGQRARLAPDVGAVRAVPSSPHSRGPFAAGSDVAPRNRHARCSPGPLINSELVADPDPDRLHLRMNRIAGASANGAHVRGSMHPSPTP